MERLYSSGFEWLSELCNKRRWKEKLVWKRGAVSREDGGNKEEDVTLYFQLIEEMKGFVVQFIAHGESGPVVIAAGHKYRLKVCVGVRKKIVNAEWRAAITW